MTEELDIEEIGGWLAIAAALAGGFLRAFQVATKGMWLDETFSVWMANQTIGEMLQWIVRIDQHPPLYYLLLHYWVALNGDTPYYARLFSVLMGAVTIPVIYLTGKRIGGTVVGLIAAGFLAFSPFHIFYAQEARMYTLLTFNAAIAIYALTCLLTDSRSAIKPIGSQFREYLQAWRTAGQVNPESQADVVSSGEISAATGWRAWITRHRWNSIRTIETDLAWIVLIVFSAATLYSHNTAVFFAVATNLFIVGLILFQKKKKSQPSSSFRAPSLKNWGIAQVGVFLLWSPWMIAFVRQAIRVDREFWIPKPNWETITQTLRTFLNPSQPGQTSQNVLLWALCAVLCLGLVYFRKRLAVVVFLVTLFAVPFLGELLVSIRRPIFYDRTLIWITLPMFLLLAAGIAQLKWRLLMIVVMGIFITNYVFTASDYYRFYRKEDWNTAAGNVAAHAEENDLILFNSNFVVIAFDYYFKPYEERNVLRVVKQGVPLDLFDSGILEPKMTAEDIPALVSLIKDHDRVWLVYSHHWYTDPLGLVPSTLASHLKMTWQRDFYGGVVQLYETP